jgi:hypothetical protein
MVRNLDFIHRSIPHIWKLLLHTLDQVFRHAEVLVVMQHLTTAQRLQFRNMRRDQICIDLARTLSPEDVGGEYRTTDRLPENIAALSYS